MKPTAPVGHTRELTGFCYVDDDRVYEVRGDAECDIVLGPVPGARTGPVGEHRMHALLPA